MLRFETCQPPPSQHLKIIPIRMTLLEDAWAPYPVIVWGYHIGRVIWLQEGTEVVYVIKKKKKKVMHIITGTS